MQNVIPRPLPPQFFYPAKITAVPKPTVTCQIGIPKHRLVNLRCSGPCSYFCNKPLTTWRIQMEDPEFRQRAAQLPNNSYRSENETHSFRHENVPVDQWIGGQPPAFFNSRDSIDCKNPNINWRFHYKDPCFVQKALDAPPGVWMNEQECHEYCSDENKCQADNFSENLTGGACQSSVVDNASSCLQFPPLGEKDKIKFPNNLQEKEWRTVNKIHCPSPCAGGTNEDEVTHYNRTVNTYDPCHLPQATADRTLDLLPSKVKLSNAKYNPPSRSTSATNLPVGSEFEDKGECTKRETRGPGPYTQQGFTIDVPLCYPQRLPCGINYKEYQTQCHSKKGIPAGYSPPSKSCPPEIPCNVHKYPPCPCSLPKSPTCPELKKVSIIPDSSSSSPCAPAWSSNCASPCSEQADSCPSNCPPPTTYTKQSPSKCASLFSLPYRYLPYYETTYSHFPSCYPPFPERPPPVKTCPYPMLPPPSKDTCAWPTNPPKTMPCPTPLRPPCPRISTPPPMSQSYHPRSKCPPNPEPPPCPKMPNEPSHSPSSLYSNSCSSFRPSKSPEIYWYYMPKENECYHQKRGCSSNEEVSSS